MTNASNKTGTIRSAGMRRLAAGAAVLALAAGALAYGLLHARNAGTAAPRLPPGQSLVAAQLEPASPLPDFSLKGGGGAFTLAQLKGRWSFVYFGYTNCPDACPATLALLTHVQQSLQAQGVPPPRIVFISVDPERDTPPVVARYAAAFGADTVGLAGDAAALRNLVAFFGVRFERKAGTDAASYTLDHSTQFFLVRPDGRWLATFSPLADGAAVLADTRTLLRLP
jgi:protein SCO1/2